ncbi:Poly-beta-1,6-N-acetyl-D-glucosamine synthase [Planctomycetaceae bacterium]|nr:Poly-beta-1,6-N-acetyl-D-glucosamine synthase [Planctomycetaceae bacterium]
MTSRISIVMPVLNEAGSIAETLRALAGCRCAGAELLLVDGGSDDATLRAAAGLADQLLDAPRGRARQMNAGAARARGEVLLFLHADTMLPDDALAAIVKTIDSGARWGRFDVTISGSSAMFPLIAALMNRRSRWSGIATGDQAMFVRRDTFEQVGGFPDQPLMEDIELSRRLRRLARPACLRARVITSGRRWERFGIWRTILLMWRLRLLYWLGAPAERLAKAYR